MGKHCSNMSTVLQGIYCLLEDRRERGREGGWVGGKEYIAYLERERER